MSRSRKTDPAVRHRRVEEVFHAVLDLPVEQRAARVAAACGQDGALRREVEELLAYHDRDTARVDAPPLEALLPLDRRDDVVGHYRLEHVLGQGGMGRIWRARDQHLDRPVAIKFLLRQGHEAAARFAREAKAISALDHPNICTIYDADTDARGRPYLVMALYDGETLAERRRHGLAPWRESVDIALQAARGLAHAHQHGVIHCDVKPSNLFLTRDGLVKVLDFGIARLLRESDASGAGQATMGTAQYMAPEQLRGEPLDARADIWSLGVVLYELLAGRPAFPGESTATTLEAVLTSEPPRLNRLRPDVPALLVETLAQMLDKNRQARPASMEVVIRKLESLPPSAAGAAPRRPPDPEAHGLYLRGRSLLTLNPAEALTQFHAALALDAQFAEAACGLAEAHLMTGIRGLVPPAEAWARLEEASAGALELDPDSGPALAFQAAARALGHHDWELAQDGFERALALTPAEAAVRSYYAACCLLPLGMVEEAITDLDDCVRADPYASLPRIVLALAHWLAGNGAEASRHATVALVQSPGCPEPVILLALTRLNGPQPAKDIARLRPLIESAHDPALTLSLLALAGDVGRARELELLSRESAVLPSRLAWAWLGAGDPARALHYLEQTVTQREFCSIFLPVSRLFAPLRRRPEFGDLLATLNF